MTHLAVGDARKTLADAVNRVVYNGERIILDRRGKPVAALVSTADLELLRAMEDRWDLDEARAALKAGKPLKEWSDFKKELGLK